MRESHRAGMLRKQPQRLMLLVPRLRGLAMGARFEFPLESDK
jgi:hypothetical protein